MLNRLVFLGLLLVSSIVNSQDFEWMQQATPDVPILVTPLNGAVNVPVNPTLIWEASEGAVSYCLELSLSPDFTIFIFQECGIVDTSFILPELEHGKTFYWRVNASEDSETSIWSDVWSFTTVPTIPSSPTLILPFNGAIDVEVNPTLVWNNVENADTYCIQISSDPEFVIIDFEECATPDTLVEISDLNTGTTYHWRVSAGNISGTSEWSAVWNFTTEAREPSHPILRLPPDGAVNISVNPLFKWFEVDNAVSYCLQIASDQDFTTLVFEECEITDTSLVVTSLANNTTYYWRVNAINSGGLSEWSEVWSFTTLLLVVIPGSPALIAPPDGATDVPISLPLIWRKTPLANSYHLQIATNSDDFGTIVSDITGIPDTVMQITELESNTTYFWRVRAANLAGSGFWSDVWSFTTKIVVVPPVRPTLVSPADGAIEVSVNPVLSWEAPGNAAGYGLQVSLRPEFSNIIIDEIAIVQPSKQILGLAYNGNYYWRVRAVNVSGSSQWSEIWSFKTTSSMTVSKTLNFPDFQNSEDYNSNDYKIAGLPGDSNVPLREIITGKPGLNQDWMAYWDNGAPLNYLVEYDAGVRFRFTTGRAFWLIHKGSLNVNTTVKAAQLDDDGSVNIPLHAGWNLITSPFIHPILWTIIKITNNVTEPIWQYNKSFTEETSFDPFQGYYFFNSTGLENLKIPFHLSNTTEKLLTGYHEPNGWQVNIKYSSSGLRDELIRFGISTDAAPDNDIYDYHKPHGLGNIPSILFSRPEWDSSYPGFATDIRPYVRDLASWDFEVVDIDKKPAVITFHPLNGIPAEYDVILVDKLRAKTTNLRESPVYYYNPITPITDFSVLVGHYEKVEEVLNFLIPEKFSMGNNFPNPFNSSTSISIDVHYETEIMIRIYDLAGQEIVTLYEGNLTPGRHFFTWDGIDHYGKPVSTGIYFLRAITDTEGSYFKKLVLIK